jgi:hypothetical protein
MKTHHSDFRGRIAGWMTVAALGALGACDDGTDASETFELVGAWTSEFGDETITETTWTNYIVQTIVSWDNATNTAILRNPPDAEWGPNDYSRVTWVGPARDTFHYCVVAFGKMTAEEAETAPEEGVDRADLTGAGCQGFPWSAMTRKP